MTLAAWMEDCGDVPDGALLAAAHSYFRSSEKWSPPPGVIRESALTLMGESPAAKAAAEWAHYTAYLEGTAPLDFEHHKKAIEVKEAVGVDNLMEEGMTNLARQRFIEEYVRQARETETLKLAGTMRLQLESK